MQQRTHMIDFVFWEFYKFWVDCCLLHVLFCRILEIQNGCTWSSKRSSSFWWMGERLTHTHTHTHTYHILFSGVVGTRALLVQRIYIIIYWLSSCIGFSCSVEHVKKSFFFLTFRLDSNISGELDEVLMFCWVVK
jgi:hypothetical protein